MKLSKKETQYLSSIVEEKMSKTNFNRLLSERVFDVHELLFNERVELSIATRLIGLDRNKC